MGLQVTVTDATGAEVENAYIRISPPMILRETVDGVTTYRLRFNIGVYRSREAAEAYCAAICEPNIIEIAYDPTTAPFAVAYDHVKAVVYPGAVDVT